MKHEKREVVTVNDVYIADDGTEFDSYSDCVKYEMSLLEKSLLLYTRNMEPCDLERCWIVNIRDEEDRQTVFTVFKYRDLTTTGLDRPGVYLYYCGVSRWFCISDMVDLAREKEKENEN